MLLKLVGKNMISDPIADALIRIKNGYLATLERVEIPYSKMKYKLIDLLVNNGFVKSYKVSGEGYRKEIVVELNYKDGKPVLTDVLKVSRPGLRVYVKKGNIPKVFGGLGIAIISTSCGLMTDREARKKKLGGELICKIW